MDSTEMTGLLRRSKPTARWWASSRKRSSRERHAGSRNEGMWEPRLEAHSNLRPASGCCRGGEPTLYLLITRSEFEVTEKGARGTNLESGIPPIPIIER